MYIITKINIFFKMFITNFVDSRYSSIMWMTEHYEV